MVDRNYETAALSYPSISLCVCTYCVLMLSEGENRIYQITKLPNAQLFVFFIMVVAAAEVSVGLAIIVMMYRNVHSTDINFLNRLKN